MVKKQKGFFAKQINFLSLAFVLIAGIVCLLNIEQGASAEFEESILQDEVAIEEVKTNLPEELQAEAEEQSEPVIVANEIPAKIIDDKSSTRKKSDGLDFSLKSLLVKVASYDAIKDYPQIKNIFSNYYRLSFDSIDATKAAYDTLSSTPDVISVEPNFQLEQITTDDIDVKPLISGTSEENGYSWGVNHIGADLYSIWNVLAENETTVKVAVIDSGIYPGHHVFDNSRIIYTDNTKNYVNGTNLPEDDNGHGTGVAGIIAESTPNNVKILPYKVLNAEGKTNDFDSVMSAAYNAAVVDKAKIINLSLGVDNVPCYTTYYDMFQEIVNAGAIIIAASGNSGLSSVAFPANCDNIVAVSSTERNRQLSSFSNYGTGGIDFAMPGGTMYVPGIETSSIIYSASGTSLSAPFLSAAAALVQTENPSYTRAQTLNTLKQYAVSLGDFSRYGNGIVDFGATMFDTPRVSLRSKATDWTKADHLEVFYVSKNDVAATAFKAGSESPTSWNSNNSAESSDPNYGVAESSEITSNGIYRYWVKSENGKVGYGEVEVKNIDRQAPGFASSPKLYSSDAPNTIGVETIDSQSGLASAKLYYRKKDSGDNFATKTNTYDNVSSQTSVKFTLSDLEEDADYQAYIVTADKLGNSSQTSTFTFRAMAANPTTLPEAGENESNATITNITPEAVKTNSSNVSSPITEDPISSSVSVFAVSSAATAIVCYFVTRRRR